MLVLSTGLTIGGLVVDLNYVWRKFRVIASLNRLMELAFRHGDELESLTTDHSAFLATLQVAGDVGRSPFPVPEGRRTAIWAALAVYLTPYVCLLVCWWLGTFDFSHA